MSQMWHTCPEDRCQGTINPFLSPVPEAMTQRAVHAWVSGRVQEVGYRQSCRSVARSLDLAGWVRNLPDGRVELFAQGETDALDRLITWAWAGPSMSVVIGVESETTQPDVTLTDFFIHPNPAITG